MTLDLELTVVRDGFRLAVALAVDAGEVVAVVGPNGAGKTTLLRAVAGLESVSHGWVRLGERWLVDTRTGVELPPERRRVGMVFQDYLLFPHLDVAANVGFAAGRDGGEWMRRLDLEALAHRPSSDLSGGERQRVALARALAASPDALLLDEPLAALDVATRNGVRSTLRRHLDELDLPVMLVTHDVIDAAVLADRVVVLEEGRITHDGGFDQLARRPRTPWAARLAGVNLYRGRGRGTEIEIGGTVLVGAEAISGEVMALIHPHSVSLHRSRPTAVSPRNVWEGEVTGLEPSGSRIRVTVDGPLPIVAEVTPAAVSDLDIGRQSRVWVAVKATEVDVYPV